MAYLIAVFHGPAKVGMKCGHHFTENTLGQKQLEGWKSL